MATPEEQQTFRLFIRILAVSQWVMAVVAGAALVLIVMFYGDTAAQATNPNRAAELSALATYRPVFMGLATLSVLVVLGGLISGICIWCRRARAFSLVVAVLGLLLFPIGTVIGLATLIALGQKPIRAFYRP